MDTQNGLRRFPTPENRWRTESRVGHSGGGEEPRPHPVQQPLRHLAATAPHVTLETKRIQKYSMVLLQVRGFPMARSLPPLQPNSTAEAVVFAAPASPEPFSPPVP